MIGATDNMPTNVIMPALGVAQQTGTLLKWLKTEGDDVAKGEPLMEIETDKATVEIEAPESGILAQVTASPGDQVAVGSRIALILAPGEKPSDLRPSPAASPASAPSRDNRGENTPAVVPSAAREQSSEFVPGRVLASPAAKRMARERGIDLATLKGSGPERSILVRDIVRASQQGRSAGMPAARATVPPLTPMRRIIAERMTQSKQSAPHFYLSVEIDMTAVAQCRAEWNGSAAARKPSHNDFILYACARALKEVPALNASFIENRIQMHSEINLGMAVALEEGLVVPVIRDSDRLTLAEIGEQSRALIVKAQGKKLLPLDYEAGTFTVSNLGMLGVDNFVAIINPPQAAILAVGRIAERVVADSGMFAIKRMMTATLSADHRVVDGALAARFLQRVKQVLERGEF